MTAAAPSWAELEGLLDVPHTLDYDEQVGYAREWRQAAVEQLATIERLHAGDPIWDPNREVNREEQRLCEQWLTDHDEPFVGGVSGGC